MSSAALGASSIPVGLSSRWGLRVGCRITKGVTKQCIARSRLTKDNSKKLWALINDTLLKVKHRGSIIPHITVDEVKQDRAKAILLNIR